MNDNCDRILDLDVDNKAMRIAAIVVTYHPNMDDFIENILRYSLTVDKILVWQNSDEVFLFPDQIRNKVILCGTKQNQLIAKALNYGLEWCKTNGYDYLLTMDQDSRWINFDFFIQRVSAIADNKVAIFSPNVNKQFIDDCKDISAESVITSGSLCNVRVADKLGGFREDYGIYWVDGEYCHWARLNGYIVKVLCDCHLEQQFGKKTKTKFGYYTSNYSPTVYYYLIRNMLWMKREYGNNPSMKCVIYTLFINVRGILLGESDKSEKIIMIFKAIYHGIFSHVEMRRR